MNAKPTESTFETWAVVALYLTAIVLANLTVALWGPGVSIVNAFVFIGIDLVARDRLHDAWRGRHLWPRMLLLIAAGSLLSWLLNRNTGPIALASFVAFACAGIADAAAYQVLRRRTWLVRANGSNVLSAAVDSVVFPTVAWGTFLPWVVLGQFAAKVLGGGVWSFILAAGSRSASGSQQRAPSSTAANSQQR